MIKQFIFDLWQDHGKWSLGRLMATFQFVKIMINYFSPEDVVTDNQLWLFFGLMGYIQITKIVKGKFFNGSQNTKDAQNV